MKSKVEGPKLNVLPRTMNLDLGQVLFGLPRAAPTEDCGKERFLGGCRSFVAPLFADNDPRPLLDVAGNDFDFGAVGQPRLHLNRSGIAVIVHPDSRHITPRPATPSLSTSLRSRLPLGRPRRLREVPLDHLPVRAPPPLRVPRLPLDLPPLRDGASF